MSLEIGHSWPGVFLLGASEFHETHFPGGGGYFKWGCAAGWGRIFTTGLTIMGFSIELLEWGSTFSEFCG